MGFSSDWLALREPADGAARDAALLARAVEAAGPEPVILDLGCGTGSTTRAMADQLPKATQWRLLDGDKTLLNRARHALGAGPDFILQDLSDVGALPLDDVTLVTASALLDLVSEDWVKSLAERLDVPFYAALSYDGAMEWAPQSPNDRDVEAFFNQHQRSDKGLGRALGPDAGPKAAAIFEAAGFDVTVAQSPWELGPDMAALQSLLNDGIAAAAAEAGLPDAPKWADIRRKTADQGRTRVGHIDLLALPHTWFQKTS
ncbi:MAG: class I SAM-dependent methyltransferase [Pseudomonadota bacterium]|mgnify:FL=1